MHNESKMFSGSAPFEYHPSHHLEAGIGQSLFHSITAMPQYQNSSFDELRMEDYEASDGIFGSKIAKLGASLCSDRPGVKLTPHRYGTLFNDAIKSFKNEKHTATADSSPAVPVNDFKADKSFPNVNLSFQGQKNVTVYINGDSKVNFSFSVESHKSSLSTESSKSSSSKSSSSKSSRSKQSRSKSYDRVDRKKSHHASGGVEKLKEKVTNDILKN
ncbi:uncharacterized protein LOC119078093 [Bradysia coprophila]|uniref:uncharacterized protein LOC119078093 n=1 Tax=Bradysia coprophila TaxID=38358 RepID=UPI00187DA1B7|nr:uncharacterized protein LOC119078093 [Bradysia coprophila]